MSREVLRKYNRRVNILNTINNSVSIKNQEKRSILKEYESTRITPDSV